MSVLITPSILAADLGHLQDEVKSIEKDADWLQVDVMDGHFVPNLSFGAPVIACIKTSLPIDIHLMVENPASRIAEFLKLHVAHITFHAEAVKQTAARKRLIKAIRKGGATAGIAIKPATPVSAIDDVVGDVDLILVMSVEPGFAGQEFLPSALEKISSLRARFPGLMIQVDGGINDKTGKLCREAGADHLVAGSFIFSAANRAQAIASLR